MPSGASSVPRGWGSQALFYHLAPKSTRWGPSRLRGERVGSVGNWKVKVRSKLGWLSAWAPSAGTLGLAGGTAPPAAWRGRAGPVWAGAQRTCRSPKARSRVPQASLSWSLHALGSLGWPGQLFCTLLKRHSAKVSSGPRSSVLPCWGALVESFPLCSSSQYWGGRGGNRQTSLVPHMLALWSWAASLPSLCPRPCREEKGTDKSHLLRP